VSASWWSCSALTHFAWPLLIAAVVISDAAAAQLAATWTDNSSGQAAFEIIRRAENEFDFSKIADVPPGSQSYLDSNVTEGVTYCYRVRAYTNSGISPYSDEACGFTVAQTFSQPGFTLWLTKAGTGDGGIMSGGNVVCGPSCTATFFPPGGVITLTAVPASGSRFVGWSGGCSGTGPCTVAGNTTVTVTATFSRM
jgi:Divergent InlB B-repeat domain